MTSYEIITDAIIKKMEQGIIPWVQPWHSFTWTCDGKTETFPCYSYSTGKRYQLINQFLLDFTAGEYATFEQIKKAGGKVKKGAKSQIVCGWIVDTHARKDKNGDVMTDDNGDELKETTFALRYYRVFNVLTQVEGLEPKHEWKKDDCNVSEHEAIENAENIISRYINSADAPKFEVIEGGNRAYYSPMEDKVVVPAMKQFDIVEEYYSTCFHELTHSTLKASRCDRKHENKNAAFGSKEYSKEELVAEIGSCFLSNKAGLDCEKAFDNSVAYLQSWIQVLKNDPKMILHASAQAEKATEYILNA